ncbi:MAG: hypothetical protein WDO14_20700 [Bacteroidota bacterium]
MSVIFEFAFDQGEIEDRRVVDFVMSIISIVPFILIVFSALQP